MEKKLEKGQLCWIWDDKDKYKEIAKYNKAFAEQWDNCQPLTAAEIWELLKKAPDFNIDDIAEWTDAEEGNDLTSAVYGSVTVEVSKPQQPQQHKFKVGDRVKVVKKIDKWKTDDSSNNWALTMNITLNKCGIITKISTNNNIGVRFAFLTDVYFYHPDSLEPVTDQPALPDIDWSEAPEWARWHGFTLGGVGAWFQNKPLIKFNGTEYMYKTAKRCDLSSYNIDPSKIDWKTTLQKRPDEINTINAILEISDNGMVVTTEDGNKLVDIQTEETIDEVTRRPVKVLKDNIVFND